MFFIRAIHIEIAQSGNGAPSQGKNGMANLSTASLERA